MPRKNPAPTTKKPKRPPILEEPVSDVEDDSDDEVEAPSPSVPEPAPVSQPPAPPATPVPATDPVRPPAQPSKKPRTAAQLATLEKATKARLKNQILREMEEERRRKEEEEARFNARIEEAVARRLRDAVGEPVPHHPSKKHKRAVRQPSPVVSSGGDDSESGDEDDDEPIPQRRGPPTMAVAPPPPLFTQIFPGMHSRSG